MISSNVSPSPEGKATRRYAAFTGRQHGADIEAHRAAFARCSDIGRDVWYRDGLIDAGISPHDALVIAERLFREAEAARMAKRTA
jgi:hypothetical protein